MESLLLEFQSKIAQIPLDIQRYLVDQIDLSNRLIAVKGARGAGKTTLLLQLTKLHLPLSSSLYVSLDHIYFFENKLYDLAKQFTQFGGTHLLLDEVHKYPNWSREIKLIYDNFPELKVIFTSSSMLEIYRSESDLSRRAVTYYLKELSFREFITFEIQKSFQNYTFQEILENHNQIASQLLEEIKPLPLFEKYLKIGVYPYYKENETLYLQKLQNTINLIIEIDINAVEYLQYDTLIKLKKLLISVASSAPFTPNITKLSEKVGVSRNMLVQSIKILERAGLVNELYKDTSGIGVLTKPEKLYLNNSNLMYALAKENSNIGNVRETFFLNQFKGLHEINRSEIADFLIDKTYTFEIGGKNKAKKQIAGTQNAYVAKDGIEIGFGNIVPVWLFGFMY
ncbi:AAA family ATPase [Galbibacter pacificus]|uniref:AAA family ATPase n=1 Tax=Galbibacter pacificus TaxID=2996052 RepID=A0ABT6FRS5_9FLAO|nr:AAA family ATPase [Galbibacter pacificus]MDG3582941.1 AAA family ATPase [Galbibacter pacificus]MDG3585940.1 AAA family ATPase [Galbibacter pacificus]